MELQFPSTPLLFSFLLFVFMVVKIVKRTRATSSTPRLPPGPWGLPLIGNMHQLVGSSLPHHTLRDLARKYGPLMHLRLGEVSTIVVSSPEIAKEVMQTHGIIFAERPYLFASRVLNYDSTNIVFSPYGDYWRQLRKICVMELLSSKRVQTFRQIRKEEVLNLIRSISSNTRSPINLSKKIFSLTHGITSRAAFGRKSKDQETFISVKEEAVALGAGFTIVDMYPSVKLLQVITGMRRTLEKMHRRIDQILEIIVNEHKGRKTTTETGKGEAEDLVDVLLRLQKHGDLEFPLTAKTKVIVNAWAIGRDPRYWTEAEKFDPERFLNSTVDFKGTDFEFIPFSAGRRMCPGISYALPNIELPLAQLLYHFDWELPIGMKQEELDMAESFGLTVRRKNDLHLIPIPYHPPPFK